MDLNIELYTKYIKAFGVGFFFLANAFGVDFRQDMKEFSTLGGM